MKGREGKDTGNDKIQHGLLSLTLEIDTTETLVSITETDALQIVEKQILKEFLVKALLSGCFSYLVSGSTMNRKKDRK